jgi:hypothetical protein
MINSRPIARGKKAPSYRDEYGTPSIITTALGEFEIDPFASVTSRIAATNYTIQDDGFTKEWNGFWFANPPFSRKEEAIERGFLYPNGIMLLPMSTDAGWWQDAARRLGYVFFLGIRLKYIGAKDSAPFESGLFPYGEEALSRIGRSGLRGIMMKVS